MYFPISGVEINPFLLPLISFVISYFTSMGGVSGAFILLPFQVSVLGFTSPAVSPTNQLYNVIAIPGGVYRYIREGRMVWPLTWAVIIGTLPGVLVGAIIRVKYLPDAKNFKVFVAIVLFYIGIRIARDIFQKASPSGKSSSAQSPNKNMPRVRTISFSFKNIIFEFGETTYRVSTPGIILLSLLVGLIGGIYGVGGGAIIAPFFVTYFGLPVYAVAGAALMGTFVTSLAGVAFYQLIAPFYPQMTVAPDLLLGALFGLGGLAGIYLGAMTQKYVSERVIKGILVFCIFFVVGKYLLEFLK